MREHLKRESLVARLRVAGALYMEAAAALEHDSMDAARWRQAVKDGEFPCRHNGEWLHVCRQTGNIIIKPTADEVMDVAISARCELAAIGAPHE